MKTLKKRYSVLGVVMLISLLGMSCFISAKPVTDLKSDKPLNYKLLSHDHYGRGLIAKPLKIGKKVYSGEGTFDANKRKVYVGWRLLAEDPDGISFNLYRRKDKDKFVRINVSPISNSTNYVDDNLPEGENFSYMVVPVLNGKEGVASDPYSITYSNQLQPYTSIHLTNNNEIEKVAIADLNGDGKMDFITKSPNGNVDPWYLEWVPSPDTYKIQAYTSDGKALWTYDMGWSIEQGTWYSPFLAYDLNGDGKAEVIVKSGEGDPRGKDGKVLTGNEYMTILDGMTGKPIARTDWIPREPFFKANSIYPYNYASRNQLLVAYLDGVHPYIIELRGTYNLMMAKAYRLEGKKLKLVWTWDNNNLRSLSNNYWGQGGHSSIAADVDGDGCDELILGSCVLDNDGKELWTTGLGHCDGMFVGDILPENPGLEIYYNVEDDCNNGNGMCLVDAKTGKILWGANYPTDHVHNTGFCSDIDRTHSGRECYGEEIYDFQGKDLNFAVAFSNKGEMIDRSFIPRLSVFWDTDNQRELLENGRIFDYKGPGVYNTDIEGSILAVADIVGDWREEIITSLPGEIRIYSTTILTNNRYNCLLQDPIYRNYVAEASNGYYELPMTTYDIPFRSAR